MDKSFGVHCSAIAAFGYGVNNISVGRLVYSLDGIASVGSYILKAVSGHAREGCRKALYLLVGLGQRFFNHYSKHCVHCVYYSVFDCGGGNCRSGEGVYILKLVCRYSRKAVGIILHSRLAV